MLVGIAAWANSSHSAFKAAVVSPQIDPFSLHYIRDLRLAEWGSGVSLRSSSPKPLMSALGQKRTLRGLHPMSALPPKADTRRRGSYVTS